jgi:hypothetical protein
MKKYRLHVPVLLISYNRPDCVRKVLAILHKVRPKKLYVACDGWKNNDDMKRCEEVRSLVLAPSWKCRIYTLFQNNNLGSRDAPYKAITWFFHKEKMGIIMEDDVVPDPSFFRYCEELLRRYESDTTVGCISGSNMIASDCSVPHSYYFSRYSQTWGWATWRRAWRKYDISIQDWPLMKKKRLLDTLFHNMWTRIYWKMIFDSVYTGTIQSAWDYQWTYTMWKNNLYTIMPKINMIRNIGFGVTNATHTRFSNWMSTISSGSTAFPLIHPVRKELQSALDELLQKRMYILWKEITMQIYRKWITFI